jgi:hypothetical protein
MAEPKKTLWSAVLLPPVVWTAQLCFGWFVASHACPGTSRPWSLGAARWAIAIATVLALAVSIRSLGAAARRRKQLAQAADVERARYLSMVGLVAGAALTLGLIYGGLPVIILRSCGEMR